MCAVRMCGVGGVAGVEEVMREAWTPQPGLWVREVRQVWITSLMEGCLQKRAQKGSGTFGPYVGHRGRQFSNCFKVELMSKLMKYLSFCSWPIPLP